VTSDTRTHCSNHSKDIVPRVTRRFCRLMSHRVHGLATLRRTCGHHVGHDVAAWHHHLTTGHVHHRHCNTERHNQDAIQKKKKKTNIRLKTEITNSSGHHSSCLRTRPNTTNKTIRSQTQTEKKYLQCTHSRCHKSTHLIHSCQQTQTISNVRTVEIDTYSNTPDMGPIIMGIIIGPI
jgi:hypothetical protein